MLRVEASSCGSFDAGAIDVDVEFAVDDLEGASELDRSWWLVGGEEWSEEPVVDLGVEDRPAHAVGGEVVGVGVRQSADEPFEPEASQVIRGLRGGVEAVERRAHPGTKTPIGEADGGVHHRTEGAGQCHDAGVSEAERRSPLALVDGGQGDALQERGRDGKALADTLDLQQPAVGGAGFGLEVGEVVEAALAADVVGLVDHRFDAQRPAFFQVLLDAGVLVEDVDGDVGAAGDDLDGKLAGRAFGDPAVEDDLHLIGASQIQVVSDDSLEESAGSARGVEHDGARYLDLTHRQLPPIARRTISGGERGRDDRSPTVEEGLEVGGAETVTDLLQGGRIITGGEPGGQLAEADASLDGLTLCPLVSVHPHLDWIREVTADLHEPRPELGVDNIEVEAADPPLRLVEAVVDSRRIAGGGSLVAGEHPLE